MKSGIRMFALTVLAVVFVASMGLAQAGGRKLDPCSLATKAEIKEALGIDVSDGKLNASNPTVCDYKVGGFGVLNFFARQNDPNDSPDTMMAELKKHNIQPAEIKGVGDRSFFAAQGYGMVQLNSFKGKTYVILTMMVPGVSEDKEKVMAEKLMQKVLAKF